MEKSIRKFLQFNGKTIFFLSKDGEYWVAIKPICEALSVNYNRQFQNIKEHKVFSQLFAEQQMVAADNKIRKMICLPERYVYGWIFQITSTSNELAAYQLKCCDILYAHFHGVITSRREIISEQIELKRQISDTEKQLQYLPEYQQLNDLKAGLMRTGKSLKDLDATLMAEQLNLFQ